LQRSVKKKKTTNTWQDDGDSRILKRSINHWNSLRPVSMSEPNTRSFALSNTFVYEKREAKNEKPMMRVNDKPDQSFQDEAGCWERRL
jgi:hypothetical protein